jgi:ectoine hydroxylase-related dioxygenase (phytanoyl-CoA dioxygenase family)/quercetin dioxygenase-like cupin family protein
MPDEQAESSHRYYEFQRNGFLAPMPLLDHEQKSFLRDLQIEDELTAKANAAKALWQIDPQVLEIARKRKITDILDTLFDGDGYYLWGAQLIDREPGMDHEWHSDIETARDGFVSLWIGIDSVTKETSLRVIPSSHQLDEPVQAHFPWPHPARLDPNGTELAKHVRKAVGSAEVVLTQCAAGEGIFFDGKLWHGTFNSTPRRRRSLLLQYGRQGVPVRHYRDRTQYPFEYDEQNLPGVLTLRGEPDAVTNQPLFSNKKGAFGVPVARTQASPELKYSKNQGWTRVPYFETETPIMERLRCHASILLSGVMPHLPHQHDEEELLIVLAGSAGILTQTAPGAQWRMRPAVAGDVFYYPCSHAHTIVNNSLGSDAKPLIYLMFRWQARNAEVRPAKALRIPSQRVRGRKRLMLDRPASRLAKLHVHTTRLEPGQEFPRHIDRYDSVFVVFRGELSVMDRALGPGGVFLTRAGELHNTANQGSEPCEYLVFEFHSQFAPSSAQAKD